VEKEKKRKEEEEKKRKEEEEKKREEEEKKRKEEEEKKSEEEEREKIEHADKMRLTHDGKCGKCLEGCYPGSPVFCSACPRSYHSTCISEGDVSVTRACELAGMKCTTRGVDDLIDPPLARASAKETKPNDRKRGTQAITLKSIACDDRDVCVWGRDHLTELNRAMYLEFPRQSASQRDIRECANKELMEKARQEHFKSLGFVIERRKQRKKT
jgi:hypothetical protein